MRQNPSPSSWSVEISLLCHAIFLASSLHQENHWKCLAGWLEPRASWLAELPDTRKDPHRILHGILRPLVSGTQHRPQSNRMEPETAVHREEGCTGLIWGTSPFRSTRALGYLASGVAWHPQGPTQDSTRDPKTSSEWNTTSARSPVRTPESGYLPCKKRAFLQRILCPLKLRRELPSQVCL